MLIYRVERNGIGPYFSVNISKKLKRMNSNHSSRGSKHWRPTPTKDILRDGKPFYMGDEEFCGFSSLLDLQDWFRGYRAELRRSGFKISIYEGEPSGIGTQQLVFVKSAATLIKQINVR